jgi:iron-sulfur cluster repair protein YtfE (RIC family)
MMQDLMSRPADSRDMYAVHNMLRRAFKELPDLTRSVPDGDGRIQLVAEHARLLVAILTTHHEAEDAILWPYLLERCPYELKSRVEGMEKQHQLLHGLLESVQAASIRWEDTRDAAQREGLAVSVEVLIAPLHAHLSDEEASILPLIDRYLTTAEWAAVGEHGLPNLTPEQVPLVFGMILRVATNDQRQLLAQNVPQEVFSQMEQVAPAVLEAYERGLHAA